MMSNFPQVNTFQLRQPVIWNTHAFYY